MPRIRKRDTSRWIKAVAATYGRKVGEIGYMFVGDEKILEINNEYLGHDYYTDIITFDYDEGNVLNGDLVISLEHVAAQAEEYGHSPLRELSFLTVHGMLHLLGYDHMEEAERQEMEEEQRHVMEELGIAR